MTAENRIEPTRVTIYRCAGPIHFKEVRVVPDPNSRYISKPFKWLTESVEVIGIATSSNHSGGT